MGSTARDAKLDSHIVNALATKLQIIERLDEETAGRIFEDELIQHIGEAKARFTPPVIPDEVELSPLKPYQRISEVVRLARICQLVKAGDRVLEIGVGRGYVTAALLANSRPSHITGMDLTDRHFTAAHELCAENAETACPVDLRVTDVHTLQPETVAEINPDVILMFEVLEHVKEPTQALRAISSSMRPTDLLIFSVPIQGRIEGCWGHRHMLNHDAVAALLQDVDLELVWVEAVFNAWAFYAAVPSGSAFEDSPRFLDHAARQPRAPQHLETRAVTSIARTRGEDIVACDQHRDVEFQGSSLVIETPNLAFLRLQLRANIPRVSATMTITAHLGDGSTACEWVSTGQLRFSPAAVTFALRPGWRSNDFEAELYDLSAPIASVTVAFDVADDIVLVQASYGPTDQDLTTPSL